MDEVQTKKNFTKNTADKLLAMEALPSNVKKINKKKPRTTLVKTFMLITNTDHRQIFSSHMTLFHPFWQV